MAVELFINSNAVGYDQLQRDLRTELAALKGVEYSEAKAAAPENVLSGEHDVLKFVIDHPSTILVVKAIIELVRSVVERRKIPTKSANPPTVIVVNGANLPLPSSPQKESRFLQRLESGKITSTKISSRPSKAKRTNKMRGKKQTPRTTRPKAKK